MTRLEEAAQPDSGAEHQGRSGAETRERILVAAVSLFLRKGFAGTSVRDITEQTQLTKAALYYHFASKDAVLDALLEPLIEEMRALVQSTGESRAPSGDEPEQVLARLVDVLSRRVGVLRILMADPSVTRRPNQKWARHGMERMAAAIARSDDPADLLAARCAIGAAQGGVVATVNQASERTPPDPDRVRRLLAGEEHLLDADQRAQVVAAAMRARG